VTEPERDAELEALRGPLEEMRSAIWAFGLLSGLIGVVGRGDRPGALDGGLPAMSALKEVLENACAVLAPQNDPFRVDTSASHRDGEWLALQAKRLGLGHRRIHVRGLHYMLVSSTGLVKPNGQPYRNVHEDWQWLVAEAAKSARWLGYMPIHQIVDARNSEPVIHILNPKPELPPRARVSIDGFEFVLSDYPIDLEPSVHVGQFRVDQPYNLVFFGEKTSLEDVLSPVSYDYRANLYLPAGEISDTMLHRMADTGAQDGRAMVVSAFRICDPAGWQMPISIARKLQAFKAVLLPELRFQVRRAALIPDQVRQHGLPSTPLKDTERRADKWREKMGVEQTEIDALATLQPALLRRIACDAVRPFFDSTLAQRCNHAQAEWQDACQAAVDEQTDQGTSTTSLSRRTRRSRKYASKSAISGSRSALTQATTICLNAPIFWSPRLPSSSMARHQSIPPRPGGAVAPAQSLQSVRRRGRTMTACATCGAPFRDLSLRVRPDQSAPLDLYVLVNSPAIPASTEPEQAHASYRRLRYGASSPFSRRSRPRAA
jgi:hypothetical protein